VIVFNGDVLSGHDLTAQLAMHTSVNADVTLHLVEVDDARRFGCVPTDDNGRVTDFLEKMPEPVTNQVNAGCYIFKRKVIATIPTDRPVSVERETFPGLLSDNAHIQAYVETAYWLDLGTPATYVQGSQDLVNGVIASSALPAEVGESLILAGAHVVAKAQVSGGSVIGHNARIGQARVDGSVLFDDVVIGDGSYVEECLIGTGAIIGSGARLVRTVVGDGAVIAGGTELQDARAWNEAGTLTVTSG
jgi:mannose-1-phosphate guanylyltransferase